ncbi:MAG: hypothetical protein IJO63_01510 [Bacilli bacterium]|nr:hypothetical protein [Bacilli bacterium]
MSSLEILKSVYKPYRYTLNKNVTIVESTSGKFVVKKQQKDLFSLFNYLENRGFNNYPEIIKNYRNEENVFEYLEEENIPKEQKLIDLAELLASLHNKTVYYKKVSIDDYKEIYESIGNNISYLSNYYESLFLSTCKEEYLSPGKYLFSRNYYKFRECLNFCKEELDLWYDLVKEKDQARVAIVHNNLSLDHFIETRDKTALISWDAYKTDTPIIDFIHLYHTEYLNLDFTPFMEKYFNTFELLDYERKLLFILISLPLYFEFQEKEFLNTKVVKENVSYIHITEKLIGPYYSGEQKE